MSAIYLYGSMICLMLPENGSVTRYVIRQEALLMNLSILETILSELNSTTPDITGSAVISVDGLPIASALRYSTNADRAGGISAALAALGGRSVREFALGNLSQVIVQGDDGWILLIQAGQETVLIITAKADAKLGMILFAARNAAKSVLNLGKY